VDSIIDIMFPSMTSTHGSNLCQLAFFLVTYHVNELLKDWLKRSFLDTSLVSVHIFATNGFCICSNIGAPSTRTHSFVQEFQSRSVLTLSNGGAGRKERNTIFALLPGSVHCIQHYTGAHLNFLLVVSFFVVIHGIATAL
jgi:hypothetical protein